jgi:sialate O-acetylesterase
VGYFFARKLHEDLNVPVGIINTSWGGTICEAWTSREALQTDADFKPILDRSAQFKAGNPNQAAVLYNGMVAPIIPYGIRGAIWYQGESNHGRAAQYAKLFPAMIEDWRERFGQGDFPFLFVQLAPFQYGNEDPRILPELWEAQTKTLSLKNTGMAVTTDIATLNDIHPKNKQDVGKRLALWALANTYGKKDVVYSGPLYDSFDVEGSKVRLKFKHVDGGLVAKDDKPLSHFEIAGEDQKFVPAEAKIDGDSIVVSSDQVAKPVAVRFAWSKTAEPNLFNKAGLPASPFRTDDWPMLTKNAK